MELTLKDQDHWEAFLSHVEKNGLEPIPEYYKDPSQRLAFRFLQATYWDYGLAHQAILENQKWVSEKLPIELQGN